MSLRHVALALGCSLVLPGQSFKPGPQVTTFFSDIDDTDQPYALYLPTGYDAGKKYPLVISLHAENSNHRLNLRRLFGKGNLPGETEAEATRYFPRLPEVNYIVACPLARGTMGYQGLAGQEVYRVLADVEARYSVDPDRVYLTGVAMGGGGALWLGLTRPDVWAAIAPLCPSVPEETRSFAPNGLNLPTHLFHGSLDPLTPADQTRRWQHDLLEAGAPVEYTEFPGVRHNCWDSAYKNASIFQWFDQFHRNLFPDRVRFVSDAYQFRSAYWVQFDALTPGTLAGIDARFTGPNQLLIQTSNLDAFTLAPFGHPRFFKTNPLQVTIDGVRLRPSRTLSFSKGEKGWRAAIYTPILTGKRLGAEGPIAQAAMARQLYVYGTSGDPTLDELKARREQALQAADWSGARSRLLLSFRILSDREVTNGDFDSADVILLGTKESNEQIARLDKQLPLSLNVSAADFGLVFIYPASKHYTLVNSGLPWWTGAETAKRGGLPFVPERLRVLQTFPDFILFKGSLEDVIAEGRFTREWKLSDAERKKLQGTGAVEVKP